MSDKSLWQGLGNLMGLGKPSAKPLATSTRRCEAGHPMAVDWLKCPYCEAARTAGVRTRVNPIEDAYPEPANPTSAGLRPAGRTTRVNQPDYDAASFEEDEVQSESPEPGSRPAAGARRTRIDTEIDRPAEVPDMPAGSSRGATRVLDIPVAGTTTPVARRPGPGRRLTGILVCFTWSALGRVYEVREGRNFCGSGGIAQEGNRDADILVSEDSTMSSEHFLILCQGGTYRISDCNSTNGTYVYGQLIDTLGIELLDGATIQAGATLLMFKKLAAPGTASTDLPPA